MMLFDNKSFYIYKVISLIVIRPHIKHLPVSVLRNYDPIIHLV